MLPPAGSRIGRRALIESGLVLGVGLLLDPPAEGQDDQTSIRPQEGDLLVRIDDPRMQALTSEDIRAEAMPIRAWPMDPETNVLRNGSRLNRVLLLRLDSSQLSPATKSRAPEGILAYTAICTHGGCEVDEWLRDEELLYCPCHGSKFDPKDEAKVVDGPAPRMLPALPLKIVDGKLVVARRFTSRVGFESF